MSLSLKKNTTLLSVVLIGISCFMPTNVLAHDEASEIEMDTTYQIAQSTKDTKETQTLSYRHEHNVSVFEVNDFGFMYNLEINVLEDWVSANGNVYSINSYLNAGALQEDEGNIKPLIWYLGQEKEVIKLHNNPTLVAFSWGMTGSGCATTPPTYGYNSYGSGYSSSYNRTLMYRQTEAVINIIHSLIKGDRWQAASHVTSFVGGAYERLGDLYVQTQTVSHSEVYGAAQSRRRVYANGSGNSNYSGWGYSTPFWSVKPC